MCCILVVTSIQLLFAYPKNQVEIWLVILFLSRQKIHAMNIFVLSRSMKLGPDGQSLLLFLKDYLVLKLPLKRNYSVLVVKRKSLDLKKERKTTGLVSFTEVGFKH